MSREPVRSAEELEAYRFAYRAAMEIYEEKKKFSAEEKYSLTDQIRRSSRSVCANLREAWAKRRYEANFVAKWADADAENRETETWLDFDKDCGQLNLEKHAVLFETVRPTGRMLGGMLKNPRAFCSPCTDSRPLSPDA